jgi:AraC-like DNA-binding protein
VEKGVFSMLDIKDDVSRLRDELAQGEIPSLQFFRQWRTGEDTRFFAKTAEGRFLAASPNVLAVNGMEREEEIVGLTDHDLFPSAMADKFRNDDRQVIASEAPLTGIREAILDRGGVLEYHVTDKFPILDRARNVVGVMGTSRRIGREELEGVASDGMAVVMRYLREHFREDVPMKVLADLVRLSLRQFHRNFKKHFGMPPNQYLIRMRVLAARDLLISDVRPIAEIAYALGFADDTLFIRQFKSRMGMTPLQYRKSKR